ncbi:HAMP domain-containing sensor histidine kinase [Kineosporia mesophila]|uniref:Signal transduction histidine-protein kinase/phosphatase MprB n=1 Tax=Kineosporia mesophila TaxID=566012 RepID=A0ABP6Z495_9ACTN|nr:HAMP domain-containing sensor histidine kinase [Kineosporia mesophila]MCD5352676.1 HAMP domain-containing histidine kinase [Kineosporia mesophila]
MDHLAELWDRLRPLDPVPSIKMKFALLVAVNLVLTAGVTWYAVVELHWRTRYGMIVASLIVLAVSQVVGHGMTLPLRQMTAAVRELAAGRPAPPLQTNSRDEVGELARAFTVMAAQLAAVDQQRRQLLADVGHELRTPVAALRAQVENLVDGVRAPDEPALGQVLAQVERLGDLLTQFLHLAGTDGGAQTLQRRPVGLKELIAPVVTEIRTARPGPSITVDVSPGLVADVDPARMSQVLTNLLDNAARHAGDGGKVTVSARALTSSTISGLALEVTDDGPGIPREDWQSVFERFGSGSPAAQGTSRLDGGTGLGLAIARWAVVLHGGRIAVVPADGDGCRIRVEIPARPGPKEF